MWRLLTKPILAAGVFGQITPPPGVARFGGTAGSGLLVFLNNILKLLIAVAGLFALLNFILAGYQFISAGGEPQNIEKAWGRIWQSLLGLLLVAGSFTLAAVFGKIIFGSWDAILRPRLFGPQ